MSGKSGGRRPGAERRLSARPPHRPGRLWRAHRRDLSLRYGHPQCPYPWCPTHTSMTVRIRYARRRCPGRYYLLSRCGSDLVLFHCAPTGIPARRSHHNRGTHAGEEGGQATARENRVPALVGGSDVRAAVPALAQEATTGRYPAVYTSLDCRRVIWYVLVTIMSAQLKHYRP